MPSELPSVGTSVGGPVALETESANLVALARNRQVVLRGHFATAVRIDEAEPIGDGFFQLRVRTPQGALVPRSSG
jgi:hypothetical protein